MSTDYLTGVEYPKPFDELALELCRSAAREVCILSPQLDHEVFDNPELAAALLELVRAGRQTRVRILISDSRGLSGRGHRLLALARRLPSSVVIRKLVEHPDWNGQTLVLRDRDGLLFKSGDSDHNGFCETSSPASARQHLELFEELWRYSVQDIELRTLSL